MADIAIIAAIAVADKQVPGRVVGMAAGMAGVATAGTVVVAETVAAVVADIAVTDSPGPETENGMLAAVAR